MANGEAPWLQMFDASGEARFMAGLLGDTGEKVKGQPQLDSPLLLLRKPHTGAEEISIPE